MDPFQPSAYSQLIDFFTMLCWLLLVPVAVLLGIVLYKIAFFLHGLSEFMTMARYEIYPTLKDLRLIADRAEVLSAKALNTAEAFENGVHAAERGVDKVKNISESLLGGVGTLAIGIGKAIFAAKRRK